MKPFYLSVEQELVLRHHPLLETWAKNQKPTNNPLHYVYIVVTQTPFGNEESGWVPAIIGPFTDDRVEKALQEVKNLLESMGATVYTPDTAPGKWVMGGLYVP
jgi:hypothetical protein